MDEEVKKLVHLYLEKQIAMKNENFANGRLVRNIYDDLVMNHARRLVNVENPGRDDLATIKVDDVILDDGKECCFSNE